MGSVESSKGSSYPSMSVPSMRLIKLPWKLKSLHGGRSINLPPRDQGLLSLCVVDRHPIAPYTRLSWYTWRWGETNKDVVLSLERGSLKGRSKAHTV